MKILWESYLGGQQSLGIVGENCVVALEALGIDVECFCWNLSNALPRHLYVDMQSARRAGYSWGIESLDNMTNKLRKIVLNSRFVLPLKEQKTALSICWGWPRQYKYRHWSNSGFSCAYVYCDYSSIYKDDVGILNQADMIFVPSTFSQNTLANSGVKKTINVWHHGVNPEIYYFIDRSSNRPYTFIYLGVAQQRKGIDVLLPAFRKAFKANEDVRLIINSADWGELGSWKKDYPDPRITWIHENTPISNIVDLYRSSDCFVLPTRGEAFCLPALEASVCGLPLIITRSGGHMDFCKDDTCYLIDVKKHGKLPEYINGPDGASWAEPDMDHLIDLLRYVYNNKEEARDKGFKGAIKNADWTWLNGTAKILPELNVSF